MGIEGLPNVNADNNDPQTQTLVRNAAQLTEDTARSASQEETQQQVNAQTALTEVTDVVHELREKQELGEGAGETPVEHAIAKLQQVQSTLTQGTKTMHTKDRLDRMANEAEAVKEVATQPVLGSKEEGAISALQRAKTGSGSKVQQETKDLSKLLNQEKSVYAAEEADQSEIGKLIEDLD